MLTVQQHSQNDIPMGSQLAAGATPSPKGNTREAQAQPGRAPLHPIGVSPPLK
ncbi:TPA: hypothetical protein ACH3X3_001251, partial [Trebouxia sp. C0006]